jgi:hypothetical protein
VADEENAKYKRAEAELEQSRLRGQLLTASVTSASAAPSLAHKRGALRKKAARDLAKAEAARRQVSAPVAADEPLLASLCWRACAGEPLSSLSWRACAGEPVLASLSWRASARAPPGPRHTRSLACEPPHPTHPAPPPRPAPSTH